MIIDATPKHTKFLNKYCDRTITNGNIHYRLQIGGISCDYILYVDGAAARLEGSEEDLAILTSQNDRP